MKDAAGAMDTPVPHTPALPGARAGCTRGINERGHHPAEHTGRWPQRGTNERDGLTVGVVWTAARTKDAEADRAQQTNNKKGDRR